ncbi:MAG: D-alanine--D-alanine ligase family protein [Lachnospiraceae bacterium]|nr:D-alanine--D-alanine ligase family protein [Lachnospiraceae bacterium]MDO5550028.1 D-alanine--D-alanine ligase family protein [Lachnospiraceae bacterium]
MMKLTAAVIFGGQSSEHEVSCMSAVNVINQIDKGTYHLILIGITKAGHWLRVDSVAEIQSGEWVNSKAEAVLSPDATKKGLIITDSQGNMSIQPIDVVFPVLHGRDGEDGTIQGLLELAKIPYVGCGVLASAVSMDKLYTKIIVDRLGFRQAAYEPVMANELSDMDSVIARIEAHIPYPVFVKPSNAGSSRGVSRADSREELEKGLQIAAAQDQKILVEEMIVGHEVECAVFGGGEEPVIASGVGEILAAAEFYDYDAKYHNAESKTVTDPELPGNASQEIPEMAKAIFQAVDGYGLSRVDFFVQQDGTVVFNEINTMPGFTAISMYPMLWEARGISKQELVEKLLEHGQKRRFG